ncbi:type IV pilus assembly protein PilN [Natronobacillus azotifigens]|uniref:PilN domain-containing protein n=1 Tax=Natronobacillus azotifigens TaxID=472978 RepID=A0A9J6R9Z5_9BACI|nr:PilN domain-containing protein [Natronobacillus azotifigens]MCZ0702405.1 PilN domain-containing protein [Natronobacillus azotifigens]
MLVEINLLPEKPKKNYLILSIAGTSIVVGLLLFLSGVIYYNSLNREIERVEKSIETVVEMQTLAMQEQSTDRTDQLLGETVTWLEAQQLSSTKVLDSLVHQLPSDGSFVNYYYSDDAEVELTARFSEERDVSSYLHNLDQSPMVTNIVVNTIQQGDNEYVASFSIRLNISQDKQTEDNDSEELEGESDES